MTWSNQVPFWTDATAPVAGTRVAPTTIADGMDLSGVVGFRVILSADSGQTLSGTGSVGFWVWSPGLARWCRDTQLDYSVAETTRDGCSPDFLAKVSYGRVLPAPIGVGVSSGGLTVQIEGWQA